MFAAARVAGWERETVIKITEELPQLLRQKSHRARTLSQIALRTLQPTEYDESSAKQILTLTFPRLEQTVVAYLQFGSVIRSFSGLGYHTRQYDDWPREALQGMMLQHPDDPVVKSYLRGYPIDDPKAAAAAYERQARVRETRSDGLRLGRLTRSLFSIDSTSYFAFRSNVGSMQYLEDTELAALDKTIVSGMELAAKVDTHVLTDDEEEQAAAVKKAQDTLIEHHLHLVTGAVDRWGKPHQREDMAGTASLALVKAGRTYVPGIEPFEVYAEEMIANALGFGTYRHRKSAEEDDYRNSIDDNRDETATE